MKHTRLLYIDRAKAIAMLSVVFGHVGLYWYNGFDTDMNYCRVSHFTNMCQLPLFMYLSGLVVSTKRISINEAFGGAIKKLRQLVIPFLVFGLLFTFLCTNSTPAGFIGNEAKFGYWYLWVLFVMYIFHNIYELLLGCTKHDRIYDIFFGLVVYVLLKLTFAVVPELYSRILSLSFIANLYVYFYLGVMTRKYQLCDTLFANIKLLMIAGVAVCAYIVIDTYSLIIPFANRLLNYGTIIFVIGLLHLTEQRNNLINRYLEFIGKSTLDVYLIHYFILRLFTLYVVGEWLNSNYNPFFELILQLLPALIIATISVVIGKLCHRYEVIEKIIYGK